MLRTPSFAAAAVAALLLSPAAAPACSLCRCDDPAVVVPGDLRFVARGWRVSFEADRNAKDQRAEVDAVVPGEPFPRERETELRYTVTGSWTVRPHLALVGRLPWSERSIEGGDVPPGAQGGLGDPELLANWCVVSAPGSSTPHWVTLQLGARAPWGSNEAIRLGVRADEHLQPGTGAAGGSFGVSGFARVAARDAMYGSSLVRVNGANRHGYHYGNAFVSSLAWQHELTSTLQGTLGLDYRNAGVDREADFLVEQTGGGVLYVTPRLQIGLGSRIALRLGVQVPVVRHLYGDQRELTNFQTSLALIP